MSYARRRMEEEKISLKYIKEFLSRSLLSLTELQEAPHMLIRTKGMNLKNWYLMLLRNNSKKMFDKEYISKSIYEEFTSYVDKAEDKLNKGESPYIETEQMLALCKSQIPTEITNNILDLIKEYIEEKSR